MKTRSRNWPIDNRQDEQDLQDENKEGKNFSSNPVYPVKQNSEKRAAIFIGPEFGTVSRPDLVAARETGDAGFDVLISDRDFPVSLTTSHMAQATVHGVDVFHPNTGEVRSDGAEGIACWFIDTDYNEESFYVRQAYFPVANDPYKALKTTLKAEINEEAWATLNSDTSRPFDKPKSGRIAVKVINHLGDEVMKVFRVS